MDPELAKLLGTGGVTAALIGLIFFVGKSLIAAIGKLTDAVTTHTKVDLEHHAEVKEAVVRLESRLDTLLDVTPIEGTRRGRTNPHGVPAGFYGPRKGTRDDG